MAINTWLNLTIDPAASKKPDNVDHRHSIVGGTADAADMTLAFDSAKFTSVSLILSALNALIRAALGRLPQ